MQEHTEQRARALFVNILLPLAKSKILQRVTICGSKKKREADRQSWVKLLLKGLRLTREVTYVGQHS